MAFAPDGRLWADVGDEVRAWQPPEEKPVASWKNAFGSEIRGVAGLAAVAAGDRWVVAAGRDGIVRVLPAGSGWQRNGWRAVVVVPGLAGKRVARRGVKYCEVGPYPGRRGDLRRGRRIQ